jgi:hypothetical protein
LRLDFFFPSRWIVPPSSADDGTLVGIGMPACFADVMATAVERSSFGAMSNCQSSSPVLDSERTERCDDMDFTVLMDCVKMSPWKSLSSSQFSIVALEILEAIRCAKLLPEAMAAARERVVVLWVVVAELCYAKVASKSVRRLGKRDLLAVGGLGGRMYQVG